MASSMIYISKSVYGFKRFYSRDMSFNQWYIFVCITWYVLVAWYPIVCFTWFFWPMTFLLFIVIARFMYFMMNIITWCLLLANSSWERSHKAETHFCHVIFFFCQIMYFSAHHIVSYNSSEACHVIFSTKDTS